MFKRMGFSVHLCHCWFGFGPLYAFARLKGFFSRRFHGGSPPSWPSPGLCLRICSHVDDLPISIPHLIAKLNPPPTLNCIFDFLWVFSFSSLQFELVTREKAIWWYVVTETNLFGPCFIFVCLHPIDELNMLMLSLTWSLQVHWPLRLQRIWFISSNLNAQGEEFIHNDHKNQAFITSFLVIKWINFECRLIICPYQVNEMSFNAAKSMKDICDRHFVRIKWWLATKEKDFHTCIW